MSIKIYVKYVKNNRDFHTTKLNLPTGALDSHSARNLMETLVMLNREFGATILMVTHDAFSASYCKTILFMKDGKIVHSLAHQKQDQWGYFMEILNTTAKVMGDSGYVS